MARILINYLADNRRREPTSVFLSLAIKERPAAMRLTAANLQRLTLGDRAAATSQLNLAPKPRIDPAAVSNDDRRHFQTETLKNGTGGGCAFAPLAVPCCHSQTPQAFAGTYWDREEDDGIDDIRAPQARGISGHAPGAWASHPRIH